MPTRLRFPGCPSAEELGWKWATATLRGNRLEAGLVIAWKWTKHQIHQISRDFALTTDTARDKLIPSDLMGLSDGLGGLAAADQACHPGWCLPTTRSFNGEAAGITCRHLGREEASVRVLEIDTWA